jgi:hypothetical protein
MSRQPMTQQEYLWQIQQQSTRYISRNKCVDSSLLTATRQAAASKTVVPTSVSQGSCAVAGVARGKGTNMEYVNVLQGAQGCAVCPTVTAADGGVVTQIILPPNCVPTPVSTVVQPCSVPGFNQYFPPKIYDGPGCRYNRITTPSG